MPWLALAGVSLISGVGNTIANMDANSRAQAVQQKNFQDWLNIHVPDPAEQKIVLQKFVQQGELDPILQKAITQAPSEFSKIVPDIQNVAAQNRALSSLEEIGHGGLRLSDKAALQDATQAAQTSARGQRDAIAAEMARRGLGGSGFDVAARLSSAQGFGDQLANSSLKTAALAQDRALKAIEDAGGLATQYRTQDFNEKAQKASAADRINQFNTANLRDVNAANTGLINRAAEMNLAGKQAISDKNTQLANDQAKYNANVNQEYYDNLLRRQAGASGQAEGIAKGIQQGGQMMGNAISNIGSGIAQGISAKSNQDFWDNYFNSQKKTPLMAKPYDPELDDPYVMNYGGSGYSSFA